MVVERLAGTDRRSMGLADQAAKEIADDQALFDQAVGALFSDDPVIRMRAADAVEKASRSRLERLYRQKEALLGPLAAIPQQEVRWHVAQMLPRLPLDLAERRRAAAILEVYLADRSTIVRVNALEALALLAAGDGELEEKVSRLLTAAAASGAPAEKARARKLLRARGAAGHGCPPGADDPGGGGTQADL